MERKVIFLADMESFYASVEIASNPSLRGKPVAVCGDPALRHGIVLAASKEAKAFGIKTGAPAWECRRLCPRIIFVRPRMRSYIECSLQITHILEQFSDRVLPYSIDEQFLDLTGCTHLFGGPWKTASAIIEKIWQETGIRCRIGMGENPLQAKMACDRFAKRNPELFFELNHANYAEHVWPLPIGELFGVGQRMVKNFHHMGVRTIGHLAGLEQKALVWRWGLNGELLWLNAHGIDYSTIGSGTAAQQKGVGHTATLSRDYAKQEEIEIVLLEMTEEVCRRARSLYKMGRVVHVYCRGADFDYPTGFSRQKRLPEPFDAAAAVYPLVRQLFRMHWDGRPIRAVGVSLSGLVDRRPVQLSLINERERQEALNQAVDQVRERFGRTSIFRAASLTPGAQLFQRAGQIGGHEA